MTEVFLYRLFDRAIRSEIELDLPYYRGTPATADLWSYREGSFDETPGELVHDVVDFDGVRRLKVWHDGQGEITFQYGAARALWSLDDREIVIDDRDELTLGPEIFLDRVVAPIAIMLEVPSVVALHASSVGDPGANAAIFIGDSGAGKSTTALELMRRGLEIVADDLVLVDLETTSIWAATPAVRLFDDPATMPEAVDHKEVFPESHKYWYRLADDTQEQAAIGLEAIYILLPEEGLPQATVEEVRGQQATVHLLSQAFDLTEATDEWRARRFRNICALARSIPTYMVRYEQSDRGAPAQVDAIAAHLAAMGERR